MYISLTSQLTNRTRSQSFLNTTFRHVARNRDWAAVTASLSILAHVAQSCCMQAARMPKSRSSHACGVHGVNRERHGRTQRGFEGGSPNAAGGLGGAVSPPAGSGAEPRKILKFFQRLRAPVSLSFLSLYCYSQLHAIFFTHSHRHHFQLNEVVPNHTL